MQALKSVENELGIKVPKLLDYEVRIPPGGKTDALVETMIKWEGGLKTMGVNTDQITAAIQATENALNTIDRYKAPARRQTKTSRSIRRPRRSKKSVPRSARKAP